jgi:hypothetical protein
MLVAELLHEQKYSLQANCKTKASALSRTDPPVLSKSDPGILN